MKISQNTQPFMPVTVLLETNDELNIMNSIFDLETEVAALVAENFELDREAVRRFMREVFSLLPCCED